jgi:hypothetical protein
MAQPGDKNIVNVTFSLITQNQYRFYSLTLLSEVLGQTCFVTARYDNPEEGFQRHALFQIEDRTR